MQSFTFAYTYLRDTASLKETRLVLPSRELETVGRLLGRFLGRLALIRDQCHLRFVYVERPGYLRRFRVMHAYKSYIFVVSRSEGRATQRLPNVYPHVMYEPQAFPAFKVCSPTRN